MSTSPSNTLGNAAAKPGRNAPAAAAPKVGLVSLGCPKALVDSERIMTRLRAEGYDLVDRRGHGRKRQGRGDRLPGRA